MEPIQLRLLQKPLRIRYSGGNVKLPPELAEQIRLDWIKRTEDSPKLSNGEVFTVTDVSDEVNEIFVDLAETDYAHYLYSHYNNGLGEYTVRVIHPAALVVMDGVTVFGSMGPHTSRPGVIQCCGGGIDRKAIDVDGTVHIERTMRDELSEELGIDTQDHGRVKSFKAKYLKSGGPTGKMTLAYEVILNESLQEFREQYAEFVRGLNDRGEEPEFDELFELKLESKAVEEFIEKYSDRLNEFMPFLLRRAARGAVSSQSVR